MDNGLWIVAEISSRFTVTRMIGVFEHMEYIMHALRKPTLCYLPLSGLNEKYYRQYKQGEFILMRMMIFCAIYPEVRDNTK